MSSSGAVGFNFCSRGVFSPNKRYTNRFNFVVVEVLKGLADLWRSRGLLKAREMMDMLFEFA